MFNLGFSELILIAIIALIFIGPKQLPEIARTIGRALNELKRASNDLSSNILNPDAYKDQTPAQKSVAQTPPQNPVAQVPVAEKTATEPLPDSIESQLKNHGNVQAPSHHETSNFDSAIENSSSPKSERKPETKS